MGSFGARSTFVRFTLRSASGRNERRPRGKDWDEDVTSPTESSRPRAWLKQVVQMPTDSGWVYQSDHPRGRATGTTSSARVERRNFARSRRLAYAKSIQMRCA